MEAEHLTAVTPDLLTAAVLSCLQLGKQAAALDILSRSAVDHQLNCSQAQHLCTEALTQLQKKFDTRCLTVVRMCLGMHALDQQRVTKQQLTHQLITLCLAKGHLQAAAEVRSRCPHASCAVVEPMRHTCVLLSQESPAVMCSLLLACTTLC